MVMRAYSPGKRRWVCWPGLAWWTWHRSWEKVRRMFIARTTCVNSFLCAHVGARVSARASRWGGVNKVLVHVRRSQPASPRQCESFICSPPPRRIASHRIVTAECMSGCVCVNGACILSRWLHRGARLTHGQCWSGLRKTSRSANGGYPNGLSQTLVRFIGRIYELCVWVCRIVWDIVSMFLRRHRVITELCEQNIVRINLLSLFFHSLHWGIREWGYIIRGCMHYTV